MREEVLLSFENWKDAATGSTTSRFYPTMTNPRHPHVAPRYLYSKSWPYSGIWDATLHPVHSMAEDLLVSVFGVPEVYERIGAHLVPRLQTVLGPTYGMPDCGLPIHIGATPAKYFDCG